MRLYTIKCLHYLINRILDFDLPQIVRVDGDIAFFVCTSVANRLNYCSRELQIDCFAFLALHKSLLIISAKDLNYLY